MPNEFDFQPDPAADAGPAIDFAPSDGIDFEPHDTLGEQFAQVGSALVTGIQRALRGADVVAEASAGVNQPSARQRRQAFERAAADPRGIAPRLDETGGWDFGPSSPGQRLYGQEAKLEEIRRPQATARAARQFDIAAAGEKLAARPRSEAMRAWDAVPDGDWWGIAKAIATDPVEIIATITAESLPSSLAGLPAGPTGVGAASGLTEFAGTLVDQAGQLGYDFTDPKGVAAFFANPQAFQAAAEVAGKRAQVIGGVDALTAGLAGRILGPTLGKGARKVAAAGAGELAMQMAGGAGGEALGSVAAGQPVSAKDVVAEAIGELGGAPAETVGNLREDLAIRRQESRRQFLESLRVEPPPLPPGVATEGSDLSLDFEADPDQAPAVEAGAGTMPAAGNGSAAADEPGAWTDAVDWENVGVVREDEPQAGETPEAASSRQAAMQGARALAGEHEVGNVDVRWAPDLRTPSGQTVEAWVDPASGRVVVNAAAPAFRSATTAAPIFREERAHQLLASEEGSRAITDFARQRMTPADREALQRAGYTRSAGMDDSSWDAYLANEFIAKQAREATPWWKELVERVKVWASKVSGGRLTLTSEEAARAVLRSLRRTRIPALPAGKATPAAATAPQLSVEPVPRPSGEEKRRFSDQTDVSADVSDATRTQVGTKAFYRPRRNEDDAAFAARLVKEVGGPEAAMAIWRNRGSGLPEAVRGFLAQAIIKQLGQAEQIAALQNPAESDRLASVAAAFIADEVFPATTSAGQFIQSFAAFSRLTPQGMLGAYRLTADRAGRKVRADLVGVLDRLARGLRKLNVDGLPELVVDPVAQRAAQEAVSKAVKAAGSVQEALRAKVLKALEGNPRARAAVAALIAKVAKGAGLPMMDLVAGHYRSLGDGLTLTQRVVQALGIPEADARPFAAAIEDVLREETAKLRDRLDDRLARVRGSEPRPARLGRAARSGLVNTSQVVDDELDAAIRTELRAMRTNLAQVLRDHYTTHTQTGQTLAERFTQSLKLPAAEAENLARQLQRRFAALLAERRRREILRQAAAAPRAYSRKLPVERLSELANAGLLGDEDVWNAVRDGLKLPAYNPTTAAEVTRRANALQRLPEGFRRDEAAIDLLRFIAQQDGVRVGDLTMALWYANVLSGPFTHLINALANITQVAAHSVFAATRNPSSIPLLLSATADGFKAGLHEAGRTLSTGKVTGSRAGLAAEAGSPLETLGNETWWKALLEKWKFVARALAAEDLLFYKAAEAQRVAVLARAVAREEGLSGQALERRAREILLGTEDQRAAAEETVRSEGLTGAMADKRRREILARERPGQVNDQARTAALRTIFNAEPFGALGVVAQGAKFVAAQLPAVRLVIPFIDVVANVTNEALNYLPPVGAARLGLARFAGRLNGQTIDLGTESGRQDFFDQAAKAAVSTAIISGFAIAASGGLDDEDPPFAVYGNGPSDPAKKAALRARGWRPWTVKVGDRYVGYADSPLAIGLGALGSYMDAIRWRKLDQASALSRVAVALVAPSRVTLERSFLKGLGDLFVALSRETTPSKAGEKAVQTAATIASGFVVPNALRQLDKLFDPTVTDSKTVEGALVSQIPFVRRIGRPALNPLGDPVQASPSDRLTTTATQDAIVRVLADKEAWVSIPDQGDLTADEYYDLVKLRGAFLKPALQERLADLQASEPKRAQAIVERLTSAYGQRAKAEILARRGK